MNWRIRLSLALVASGTIFALACLYRTTALSMTFFFLFGLPLYGVGALLYVVEILRDLRKHKVL